VRADESDGWVGGKSKTMRKDVGMSGRRGRKSDVSNVLFEWNHCGERMVYVWLFGPLMVSALHFTHIVRPHWKSGNQSQI